MEANANHLCSKMRTEAERRRDDVRILAFTRKLRIVDQSKGLPGAGGSAVLS